MSNSAHTLITNRVFGIDLPATKSAVESDQADLSKNSREFRNLDSNFLIDNGYIRFSDDGSDFSHLPTFIEAVESSIRKNLISSDKIKLIPLSAQELKHITHNYGASELNVPLIVALANDVCAIRMRPGQHHIAGAIDYTPSSNDARLQELRDYLSELPEHDIHLNRHEFVYFLPNALRKVDCNELSELVWFKVIDTGENLLFRYNFHNFNAMIGEFHYTFVEMVNPMACSWNSWIPEDRLRKLVTGFTDLQERGWGQLMNISEETLTFRVRTMSTDQIMRMDEPSLYEATYEVVYFHDMSKRIQQSNYNKVDRFEVRTSGFIARRRNDNYTADLYRLCTRCSEICGESCRDLCDDSFEFDVLKVAEYLRNSSFNDTIKRWYPREEKSEMVGMCLTNVKTYSTMVFRYRTLDKKNLTRMLMIEDWIKELELRGGFVISGTSDQNDSKKSGYLIVSGESIVYGHTGKTGDLNTFLERYDSFHWKRVRRYSDKTSDFLFDLKYNDLPESYFVIDHDTLNSDDSYSTIREIVQQFS